MSPKKKVETLGDIFKKMRQEKNLTISKLSDETRIPSNYLEALEKNNFAKFPAKIYLMGFIENLCEYLSLDKATALQKLREITAEKTETTKSDLSTTPPAPSSHTAVVDETSTEESIVKTTFLEKINSFSFHPRKLFLTNPRFTKVILLASIVFLITTLLFWMFFKKNNNTQLIEGTFENQKHTYKMYQKVGSFDLRQEDSVQILDESIKSEIKLKTLEPNSADVLINNTTTLTLKENNRFFLDINEDGENDIELQLKKIWGALGTLYINVLNEEEVEVNVEKLLAQKTPIKVGKEYYLFKNFKKVPIQIYVKAKKQPSYITYNVDGERQNSKTIEPGKSLVIEAENHAEVQFGNYRHLFVMINQEPIDMLLDDNDKFSITKIIKWIPDPNNETLFHLIIKDYVY